MPLIITLHITDSFMDKSLSSKDTIQNSREGGRGRERERERESTSIMQKPQSLMRTLSLVSRFGIRIREARLYMDNSALEIN